MNYFVGLAVSALAGIFGNALVKFFDGTCPVAPTLFICTIWEPLATGAAFVLGALGYTGARWVGLRQGVVKKMSAPSRALSAPASPEAPEPPTSPFPMSEGD